MHLFLKIFGLKMLFCSYFLWSMLAFWRQIDDKEYFNTTLEEYLIMDNIYRIFNVLAQFLFPSSQSEPEYHQKMNVRVPY